MTEDNLRIIELTAENIKKLRVVRIRPDGALVQITGKNGSGKSSVLDAIAWALGGSALVQAAPIRRGQVAARVTLDLGELVVTRRFAEGRATTLTVESADGARFPSPQRLLDGIVGELSLDPVAFLGLRPREQFDALLRLTPLAPDLANLDELARVDHERRTELGRQARDRQAQADGITVPEGLPEAAPDVEAATRAMVEAGRANAELAKRRERREADQRDLEATRTALAGLEAAKPVALKMIADSYDKEITELEARIKIARDEKERDIIAAEHEQAGKIKHHAGRAAELDQRLTGAEPLPEPADLLLLERQAHLARLQADGVRLRERRAEVQGQANELTYKVDVLTSRLQAHAKKKVELLAAAALPVSGLGLADGHVTLDGLPLEQASGAERLRVSVAVAMAASPRLRVLRVREGSLLDSEGLAVLGRMAEERGYQVWVERVTDGQAVGVVLEDGEVAS